MFIAALFTIAKTWEQPKCPPADKWIKKTWHTHAMEWAALAAQSVKSLPAARETRAQSLGREDPLQKGMATRSSILASRVPWTEEPGRLQSMRSKRVEHSWVTNTQCTMEYHSFTEKNEMLPFATTQKDLEMIILSEVGKGKHHVISLICGT